MHRCDKEVIRQNYSFLVKHIPTLKVLLHLYQVGIFTEKDCNTVLGNKTRTDSKQESRAQLPRADSTRSGARARVTAKQNKRLLYILERRGPYAITLFLNSLSSEILYQLKTLENNLSKLQI